MLMLNCSKKLNILVQSPNHRPLPSGMGKLQTHVLRYMSFPFFWLVDRQCFGTVRGEYANCQTGTAVRGIHEGGSRQILTSISYTSSMKLALVSSLPTERLKWLGVTFMSYRLWA